MRFEIKNLEPMGAVRMTRRGKYTNDYAQRYLNYKKTIYYEVLKQLNSDYKPMDGAIGISIVFYMPIPASWPKYAKEAAPGTYCTTKPDIDNLAKGLFDSLNGLLWVDDNRIFAMDVKKEYSNEPGIDFSFFSMGELSHGQTKKPKKETKQRATREKAPGTRRNISKRI